MQLKITRETSAPNWGKNTSRLKKELIFSPFCSLIVFPEFLMQCSPYWIAEKRKRQSCPLFRTSGLGARVPNFATKIKDSMSPTRVCCSATESQQRHSTVQWHFQHACFCIRVDDGWGRVT